jgi:hypothetical protein
MQDNRPPIVTNWIKAEKQRDPELAKLLEGKVTSLFVEPTKCRGLSKNDPFLKPKS